MEASKGRRCGCMTKGKQCTASVERCKHSCQMEKETTFTATCLATLWALQHLCKQQQLDVTVKAQCCAHYVATLLQHERT